MPVRRFFKQLVLVLVISALLFTITACNRKDNGVAPTPTTAIESQTQLSFKPPMALIEAATSSISLVSLPENPPSPEEMITVLHANGVAPRISAETQDTVKAAIAPNPSGPNLAASALPSASSVWPWPMPYGPGGSSIWLYPNLAIDGVLTSFWMSSFSSWNHWYQLSWAQPVNVSRIFMTKDYGVAAHVMQTVQQIKYYDSSTSSWQTFPGSTGTFSGGTGNYDRTFAPVTTTGIMVYLNTGPVNPHPNVCVWIDEIEVYGPEASLKITSPADNSIFPRGQPITFVGEKTGTVNNIQWSSNLDGLIGTNFPTIATSGLRVGTHTITLSGQSNSGQPLSDSITVGVTGGKPRVKKVDFLSMSGQNNLNRIYDRKGEHRQSTFLEPTQWQGKEVSGDIEEDYCWPVSYVRSDAKDLGYGPSKLKLEATFKDMDNSSSLSFEVQLVGKLYQGGQLKHTLSFNPKTINTTGNTEKTEVFESTNGLPNVVGIWALELEWQFLQSGTSVGSQRTPESGAFQTLFTTWERPLDSGDFQVGVECIPGYFYCKEMPTYYLEILRFSCFFLDGFGSTKTGEEIMTRNLVDTYDRVAGLGYKYSTTPPIDGVTRRGLDRLLDETIMTGWCREWGHLYKALTEAHGVNVYSVVGRLKPAYVIDSRYAISADGITHAAPGAIRPMDLLPPDPTRTLWTFKNHHFLVKSAGAASFDPTFSVIGPVYFSYFDNLFEFIDSDTLFVDINVLGYVDFDFEG